MSDRKSGRARVLRSAIYQQAEQHRRRLEKKTIDAANAEWIHNEAMSAAYNAYSNPKIDEELARLATLNASYFDNAAASVAPTMPARFLRFPGLAQILGPAPHR